MRKVACLALLLVAVPYAAFADTLVPPTFTNGFTNFYAGGRSGQPGIVATGGWTNGGFHIDWTITQSLATGLFDYKYTITTGGSSVFDPLRYWILEVSSSFTCPDHIIINNVDPLCGAGVALGTWSTPAGEIFGLKFDLSGSTPQSTFEFVTDRAPVWGDFFADNGLTCPLCTHSYAYNAGFGTEPAGSFTGFIARPDTISVPEPATLLLLCCGIVAAGFRCKGKLVRKPRRIAAG